MRAVVIAASCLAGGLVCGGAGEAAAVDFNREIRPILSENCFLCHGPDENDRKGGLRLDVREDAVRLGKGGGAAIVPGKPEASELLARVTHEDPDEVMPPARSGKRLSEEQIDTLRRWISEGAPYAVHWSYVKPERPELPAVKDTTWPRNGIDHFILNRLEQEGLEPLPEADRPSLARRVALDLTGLPPALEDVEELLNDSSPGAYERYIDRLLASKAFGEHWARSWLDLARYADSAGYADDPLRTIWAYRDYVINSFNANKPFDQFTIEQIAGDLLEEPTEEQLIATAFHRNTMTNNEGGTNDEEFRNEAVIDRVNTTFSVWMGTSMACAQCHTHKYDPISQKEFFQFMAFLNNTEDADRNDESPLLRFFTEPQKEQRGRLEGAIRDLEKVLATPTDELRAGFEAWHGAFPRGAEWNTLKPGKVEHLRSGAAEIKEDGRVRVDSAKSKDIYIVEAPVEGGRIAAVRLEAFAEEAPAGEVVVTSVSAVLVPPGPASLRGRYLRIEIPGPEKFLSLAEVQVFRGDGNIALSGQASQSSTALGAKASLAIDGNTDGNFNARSTAHTDKSESPWWELDMLEEREVDRIVIWNRTDNNLQSRLKDFTVTILDEDRKVAWQRQVAQPPNPSVEMMVDGTRMIPFAAAYADTPEQGSKLAGVIGRGNNEGGWLAGSGDSAETRWLTLLAGEPVEFEPGARLRLRIEHRSGKDHRTLGSFRVLASAEAGFTGYQQAASEILSLLSRPEPAEADQERMLEYYVRRLAPGLASERQRLAALEKELEAVKPHTVPIMRELEGDKRRVTRLQYRGSFMDLGEEVEAAVPAVFHPLPDGAPRNRLGMARWLVDEKNPLTGRVLANRFWEQIFGAGLVLTSEEFGSQGEPPSHPELLDWLALDFTSDWDMKRFLKLLVSSAAYRQSSRVTPELVERDPDNRLLARGPRFRMPAEMVRDQALAVGGLLSGKIGGPSVRPARPSSGLSAAFGASVDWKASDGEDRFRRGLYTEWRRTSPYPSMVTFDAPNREVCTLRRNRTNTPLQALVTLNDPVYLEAARGLARRMAGTDGGAAERVRLGFQLCLLREPGKDETGVLLALFEEAKERFAAEPESATQFGLDEIGEAPEGMEPVELAALAVVANVLLNLDETLMRR